MARRHFADRDAEGERERKSSALPIWRTRQGLWRVPSKALNARFAMETIVANLRETFGRAITYEVETGTPFNLLPACLAIGIAIYFSAPSEPNTLALVATLFAMVFIQMRVRSRNLSFYGLAIAAAIMAGMTLGKVQVLLHQNHPIERLVTTELTAIILSVDQNRRGVPRYLVRPLSIEKMENRPLPKRLRISASSKADPFEPGDTIKGLARLQPVLGPVLPGGYDFSFFAWFDELGSSGFFMGAPSKIEAGDAVTATERLLIETNRFRQGIENRIKRAVPGRNGAILVALVTGNRSGIPPDIQQALRVTGLAHILAISGLHMALVTLTVIWLVRTLLVRVGHLALHYPIKKIAVCAGFASASIYLVISGAGVATQRAWIMISVMLLAVLLDRRAITMRSVAIAALVILALSPQSLFAPGFQMSFAAVAALVAGYELLNRRREALSDQRSHKANSNLVMRMIKMISTYAIGILLTSLIAGSATAFVAAWHFHQVAPLGLFANGLAMPFVTILIMPFLLFSILLMPYGLEALALTPASFGVDQVISIAAYVASKSPSGMIGGMHPIALLLFAVFLCGLTIPKTRLRLLSFAFLPIALLIPKMPPVPDVIVAESGRAVGVKTADNELEILKGRAGSFATEIWRKSYGLEKLEKARLSKEQCNKDRCIYVLPGSKILHLIYNPDLLQASCNRADILIAPRLWWVNCRKREPGLILKRHDFEQKGTHAIYVEEKPATNQPGRVAQYKIKTALPDYSRPWHRRVTPKD